MLSEPGIALHRVTPQINFILILSVRYSPVCLSVYVHVVSLIVSCVVFQFLICLIRFFVF